MRKKNKLLTIAGCAALVATAVQLRPAEVTAADHADGAQSFGDPAADITDVYAWVTDDVDNPRLIVIIGYAGLTEAGGDPTYDADVLYTLHIDATGNRQADTNVYVRFGQNLLDEWGVRVDNLPGEDGPFEGPVGGEVSGKNGGRVQTGLFDDPFFFDFEGFGLTQQSIMNDGPDAANLMFDNTRDFFAMTNISAIVLDMDPAVLGADGVGQLWVTTGRRTPK